MQAQTAGPGETLVFAQVELGGIAFAIPAHCVVRALPRPGGLAPVPRAGTAIDGAFTDDGRVLPLVDLRHWMKSRDTAGAPPLVMVLDAGGRGIGLAIDAVRGTLRIPAARIRKLHHDAAPDEFFHSVAMLDDGATLVGLLDPVRLMGQVQVWTQHETAAVHADRAAEGAAAAAPLFALVRMAGRIIAVDVAHVSEIVRGAPVQALDLGDSKVAGMVQRRGLQIPLLAGLPGLEPSSSTVAGELVLLLSGDDRALALPVDAVHSVQQIDISTLLPAEQSGLAINSCFSGIARCNDGATVLLLDSHALLEAYAVAGLSDDHAAARRPDAQLAQNMAEAHIVVHAGQEWAIPMSSVSEIVALPDEIETLPCPARQVVGSARWRGTPVPVLDIRGETRGNSPSMVVVRHGTRHAGLLADALPALLASNCATRSRFRVAGGEAIDMLTVGAAGSRKSYQVLDLGALPLFSGAAQIS